MRNHRRRAFGLYRRRGYYRLRYACGHEQTAGPVPYGHIWRRFLEYQSKLTVCDVCLDSDPWLTVFD